MDISGIVFSVEVNVDGPLEIGEKLIFNVLVERLMGLPGVYNVAISAPTGDRTPTFNEVYTKGTKTITVGIL